MIARLYKLAMQKLRGQREPARAYELGRKKFPGHVEHNIEYITNQRSNHFAVGQGVGRDACGSMISARELLTHDWIRHLMLSGADWLIPLLERFAAGEPVTTEAVLRAYEQQHGNPPPFRDIETP